MRLATIFAALALCVPTLGRAVTTQDFQGRWVVRRDVGSSDVLANTNPRTMWGTKVVWTAGKVTDAEGECKFVAPMVKPVPNKMLEHYLWAGQKITGLELSKAQIAAAFGKTATPVFDDGGRHCAPAVLLNPKQMLLIFSNGYIYLLDRVGR